MTEQEALAVMIPPGQRRATKWRGGVIQIIVTSSCNLACFGCTQGSNFVRKPWFMTPDQFEQACLSLRGYFGVVGVFGGNPAVSKHFGAYCEILRRHFPKNQRGLWCNHPLGWGKEMRATFDPSISNLNCHLDQAAFDEFKRDWPESVPFGVNEDSRHSPPWIAMKDIIADESERWKLISGCDINRFWSAAIGVFRGGLRAWFCEVAGAQAMLHQDDPDCPDTGMDPTHLHNEMIWTDDMSPGRELPWWQLPMTAFTRQVRRHCHDCGVPLRGRGELAQAENGTEQVSAAHAAACRPKRLGRRVEVVERVEQLGIVRLRSVVRYLQNSHV